MKTTKLKFRKINLLFIGLITITILMASCEKPDQDDTDGITDKDVQAMRENHIIDLKNAVKTYDKYTKQRVKILKDTLKKKYGSDFNDTRNVWFDIKTIKAYLKYLEDNASEAEGLQFYFSVNPDNGGKQKNHQTFFVAPTVQNVVNGDTIQSGYTVIDDKRVFIYEAVKSYLEEQPQNIQKASFLNLAQDEDGYLFNVGTLGPPNGNN